MKIKILTIDGVGEENIEISGFLKDRQGKRFSPYSFFSGSI